ncbi:putative membrane-anchored protein [Bacillus mesophilus]|uniref:DUF1129 domain-containing protein n=1 Tax=Bacillus mesophilus TaxID=1808955 RepID=A0A6M0QBD4_9BACI|nr:hypothetical protein [Bacillus mesophilus]MBM7662297.1 putative membrane-anchored protein [Bacillus mesophilus]NEY73069.1 hypothetical protein [Bacillus mesophilus]
MLSKQSDQFLIELRLYLLSKGKNEKEVNEITEELEVHLMEAELEGKDVRHIIGESPKQYMKSIGESMSTDYRQMVGLIPMMILLLAAYFSFGPALEDSFSLSKGIILIAIVGGMIGLVIYSFLLFKVLPKFLHSKWGYMLTIGTSFLVTGLGVIVLLWYREQGFQSVYIATPFQNNVIILVCIAIFIASALYTKTWFTILVPLFLSLGPIASRFIPEDIDKNPTYIFYTILILVVITAIVIFFLVKRKRS